jgi:hypothetical protein
VATSVFSTTLLTSEASEFNSAVEPARCVNGNLLSYAAITEPWTRTGLENPGRHVEAVLNRMPASPPHVDEAKFKLFEWTK